MNTKFEWSPDTRFSVSGLVVSTMINHINSKLQDPQAQEIIRLYECSRELQEMLKVGLESGKVQQIAE